MQLMIDSKALEQHSERLKDLNRSAFPVAVRETLTDCARDMKMQTILKSAKEKFTEREPNFFKANSSYDRATGFSVGNMKATVGMAESKLRGGDNYAIKDLEEQEFGGQIENKSFIPMNEARSGKSPKKLVRPNARLKYIKNIVNIKNVKGENKAQRFLLAAMKAGNGGYVLGAVNKGESVLWKINSVSSSLKSKGLVVKANPLYDYSRNRAITVKPRHFMEKAGSDTHKKIDDFYIERAEKAFQKYWQ